MYDSYVFEIQKRAKQLLGDDSVFAESVTPTSYKFGVDRDELNSFIDCKLIEGMAGYGDLGGTSLRSNLETRMR